MAASVWDFVMCTQMLMHAIVHGGCADTVTESALKVTCNISRLKSSGTHLQTVYHLAYYESNFNSVRLDKNSFTC